MTRHRRDLSLEGIRGVAAVIVVLSHNLIGFFPRQSGYFAEYHHSGERAMPWFGIFNGTAAVTVFFVLSGLVLSRAYLQTGDESIIARGALKRWPRLAGPVMLVVALSAVLDLLGLYRFDEAAALTGSPWLAGHLFHGVPPGSRSILDAVMQGALTFFRGDSYYDSSLWTMRYEMTGSYMVFGLTLILGQLRGSVAAVVYLLVVYALIYYYLDVNMVAFLVGVLIAYVQCLRQFVIRTWAATGAILFAFFLLGYSSAALGWYRPLAALLRGYDTRYVYIVAAAIVIVSVDCSPAMKALLNRRWSALLGWLSFPLYLVHIPILCSLGAAVFLKSLPLVGPRGASVAASLVTLGASFAAAVPLAMLNDIWTRRVDGLARRFCVGTATETG